MNQRALAITKAYVFESDDESHINANELSDLSDVFDEDDDHSVTDIERGGHIPSSSISLDDIPCVACTSPLPSSSHPDPVPCVQV